ncbi:MAG: YdbL family protein [Gammaproteobacteria bacterium]|nr:YdbL family protein [Gammaproteobacteria bacterium]
MTMKAFLAASLIWALGTGGVFAMDLDSAKAKGLVGETPDGYIAAVGATSDREVLHLVQDVNTKRREVYEQLAAKNKADIRSVEALAGAKAIQRTPNGQMVYLDGRWQQKQ